MVEAHRFRSFERAAGGRRGAPAGGAFFATCAYPARDARRRAILALGLPKSVLSCRSCLSAMQGPRKVRRRQTRATLRVNRKREQMFHVKHPRAPSPVGEPEAARNELLNGLIPILAGSPTKSAQSQPTMGAHAKTRGNTETAPAENGGRKDPLQARGRSYAARTSHACCRLGVRG